MWGGHQSLMERDFFPCFLNRKLDVGLLTLSAFPKLIYSFVLQQRPSAAEKIKNKLKNFFQLKNKITRPGLKKMECF